jgi:hypothetical protein
MVRKIFKNLDPLEIDRYIFLNEKTEDWTAASGVPFDPGGVQENLHEVHVFESINSISSDFPTN